MIVAGARTMIRLARCSRPVRACSLRSRRARQPQQTTANEDGYDLWLRYRRVADAARLAEYRAAYRSSS